MADPSRSTNPYSGEVWRNVAIFPRTRFEGALARSAAQAELGGDAARGPYCACERFCGRLAKGLVAERIAPREFEQQYWGSRRPGKGEAKLTIPQQSPRA